MHEPEDSSLPPVKRLLWVPVRAPGPTLLAAAMLGLYYLLTMQRSLSMYDSPELAMVAEQLGLGHPTGQPLHTLLGWLASRFGPNPLVSLNALSAVVGALTIVPAVSLADSAAGPRDGWSGSRLIVPFTVAAVALHPLLWEPATRIETYPLAVFFSIWTAARLNAAVLGHDVRWASYGSVGLALGLAASANPYCALGTALAMAPRLSAALVRHEAPLRSMSAAIPAGLLGLLPYAYVPLAARRADVVAWGRPNDFEALRRYFTGADYARSRELTSEIFLDNLSDMVSWANTQGIVALLLLGLLGYAIERRQGGIGLTFYVASVLLFGALLASNAVFAPDVLDYLGYLALPGWLAASGIGVLARASHERSWQIAALTALGVAALLALSKPSPWHRTRHLDDVTEVIAERALRSAPERAILVVESDHWAAPLWYLQEQRGLRPDVVTLAYGLASSNWYWEHLFARHPELTRVALRGGERASRVRSFLAANASRPVLLESIGLAHSLDARGCLGDWLWSVADGCDSVESAAIVDYIAEARLRLNDGSPGTAGLLAALAFTHGYGLQSLGYPRAAARALVSAAPASALAQRLDWSALPERSDLGLRWPNYEPRVALGDPARNVDFAARIAEAHGADALARDLDTLSKRLGPVRLVAR